MSKPWSLLHCERYGTCGDEGKHIVCIYKQKSEESPNPFIIDSGVAHRKRGIN